MPEKSEFDKALGELYDLTEWEDAEAAIRELHARGPEIERLYLDSKILPGELRALVIVDHPSAARHRAAASHEYFIGDSTMSDDGMFCPYKKSTKREVSYSWISRTEITTERFGWCSEKKCMAYNNGRCKILEGEIAHE